MRSIHRFIASIAHWFRYERPVLLNNPVILREVIDRLRKKSSFVYLLITLMVGIGLLVFSWNDLVRAHVQFGRAQWNASRDLLLMVNLVLGSAIFFMTPLFSSTCINLEKERDSWDLLTTTPLSAASILWAKFVSCMFFIWILMLSLLPIYGLCFTLGGVSPEEIAFIFWLFTEVILATVLVGILSSILIDKSLKSISSTYFTIVAFFVGIPIFSIAWSERFNEPFLLGIPFLLSPLVISICYYEQPPPGEYYIGLFGNNIYLTHAVLFAFFLLCLAWISVRKIQKERHRKKHSLFAALLLNLRDNGLLRTGSRSNRPPDAIPDRKNPIFIKEYKEAFGRHNTQLIKSSVYWSIFSITLFIFFSFVERRYDYGLRVWLECMPFVAIMALPLLVVPYAVNSFRNEQDRNTWDLLATTTLSNRRIFWGKYFAGLYVVQWKMAACYGICLVGLGLAGIIDLIDMDSESIIWRISNDRNQLLLRRLLWAIPIAVCSASMLMAIGLYISSRMNSTLPAYTVTFGVAIGLYLLLPLLIRLALFNRVTMMRNTEWNYIVSLLASIPSPFFILTLLGHRGLGDIEAHATWLLLFAGYTVFCVVIILVCVRLIVSKLNQSSASS